MKRHLLLSILAIASAVNMQAWDGSVADSYEGGSGTEADPYLIANASQWARLAQDVATIEDFSKGKYFRLTADIVFNDSVYDGIVRSTRQDKEDLPKDATRYKETPCVGTYTSDTDYIAFEGTFDGDGHTISGMMGSLYRSQTYDALFRVLQGATIKNLGVSDSYLLSNARLGGLAGRMTDSRIINCYIEHSFIEGGGSQSGGFVGQMFGASEVLNCYAVDVIVFGKNDMGGFIGRIGDSNENPCQVDNCYSRVELRVKRRNHGAVSFACCSGSMVRNVYYEKLGEITNDFWTGNKNGQVENVVELSATQFASTDFVDSLNQRAAQIPGACRWKQVDGRAVHDYSTKTPIDTSVRTLMERPTASDAPVYSVSGRRMSAGQLRKGIYIRSGKKFVVY